MILQSKDSQFSLSQAGEILWQEKLNNPMPGVPVAQLKKGDNPLKPVIAVIDNDITTAVDATALKNQLAIWLQTHMSTVLESLMLLEVPAGVAVQDDPVSVIAAKVYDRLGVLPREELESVIAELTPETRADLRAKKIRLGPILVFMPSLNKPAAVKLRALLWSLYHDVALPALTPPDGIVSQVIEDQGANKEYYRAIGYPIYGDRAVRIDMLDRVINCVYDHAAQGKFQARHEMAEWLGCTIEGLYKILEDMGHTKVYDPADHVVAADEGAEKPAVTAEELAPAVESAAVEKAVAMQDGVAQDATPDAPQPSEAETETADGVAPKPAPKPQVKPELATFRLKKGKAFKSAQGGRSFKKHDEAGKKPYNADKPKKPRPPQKKHKSNAPKIISVEAKKSAEDSPFAILQQLKK